MVPVLQCVGCGRETQVPYRSFISSSIVEPYWPDGDERLAWVCDGCGLYQAVTMQRLGWRLPEDLPPHPYVWGFWRVENSCPSLGCPLTVVAHIQTFGMTTRRNLGLMITKALPTPVCGRGHFLVTADPTPARIDYVEYIGPDQYVI